MLRDPPCRHNTQVYCTVTPPPSSHMPHFLSLPCIALRSPDEACRLLAQTFPSTHTAQLALIPPPLPLLCSSDEAFQLADSSLGAGRWSRLDQAEGVVGPGWVQCLK